jgi:hypothetical protein
MVMAMAASVSAGLISDGLGTSADIASNGHGFLAQLASEAK